MPADSTLIEPELHQRTRSALIYKVSNFRDFVGRMNAILDDLSREERESATLSIRPMLGGDDLWIGARINLPATETV